MLGRVILITVMMAGLFPAAEMGMQETVPRFEPGECPEPLAGLDGVECGQLIVPENRDGPESRSISLTVAIFRARSENPAPDPVIYLEGGPGGSAIDYGRWAAISPIREQRDLILYEQRGNRYADPWLDCPEISEAFIDNMERGLSPAEEAPTELAAAEACRDRFLAEGVDLSGYTSAESAADVADLGRVLGYEEWNLYGVSYGTRLGLTVLRDHPEGVRSVILDSVYPPEASSWAMLTANAAWLFDRVFDDCAADTECTATYPELEAHFYAVLDRANAEPITIEGIEQPRTFRLTGPDIVGGLAQGMYDPDFTAITPLLIEELYRGSDTVLVPLVDMLADRLGDISMGAYLSIECYERYPFEPPEVIAAAAADYPPQLHDPLFTRVEWCEAWETEPVDPVEHEPVSSDVPVLLLSGAVDPITPPRDAAQAAEMLSSGYWYEFPGEGHAVSFGGCPQQMMLAFLDDPGAAPDSGCLSEMDTVEFVSDIYTTTAFYRLNVDLLSRRPLGWFGLLGFCLLFFLAEILMRLVGLVFRRGRNDPRGAQAAHIVSGSMAAVNLGFLTGLILAIRQATASNWLILALGIPAKWAWVLYLPVLSGAAGIGMAYFVYRAIREGYWNRVWRIHYILATAAALAFTLFCVYWGLVRLL
ncbi:MAG: alpha/beta fold hydrolase [Anaerolineae bacterium]|nr:alpha/beta fold hydrolase [Anaerolineae bacterium]